MSSDALTRTRWPARARGHLTLARISNSPTVGTNALAGAALAGALQPGVGTLLVAVAMVLFYTAGMYLNDLMDYRIDCLERPERPLPSGLISRDEARLVTTLLFVVGLALLALVSLTAVWAGLALVALIFVYDRWHKANPLSPVLMAGTRMLVYVTAFLALAPHVTPPLVVWTVLLGLYTVGMTQIAKTERRADLSRYWPAALLILPVVYAALSLPALTLGGVALLLAFPLWVGYSLLFLYSPAQRDVGRAVGHLIAGISLLDALVLLNRHAPTALILLALAAFALTVYWQRSIKGT